MSDLSPVCHTLEVWGDFACFTRPELKVERFSYPVITPSAARGIFDAIYCKPREFRWQIVRIEVLAPPSYIGLRRNEVKQKASESEIQRWMASKKEPEPIWADADKAFYGCDTKGRTQRQTMALRDVRYRLHGEILPWTDFRHQQRCLDDQFVRRASHGKCFQQPYFGCREFPAYFELPTEASAQPAAYSADLGWMLYDVFDLAHQGTATSKAAVSLFRARVVDGVLDVPAYGSDAVVKSEARA